MSKMKDAGGINSLHRLKLRCRVNEFTDCWEWSMAVYTSSGLPIAHARYPWAPDTKKKTTGKRAALMFKMGKPIPNGWFVWGTCGNSLCCNPNHAECGDAKAYGEAMRKYGWHKNTPAHIRANRELMKCKRKLTDEQAAEIRASSLPCKTLSQMYGLAPSGISAIKVGKRYAPASVIGSSIFNMGRAA